MTEAGPVVGPVVLVTGGAGYVGSHVCLALHEAGFRPVVYDNLTNGHAAFVQWGPLEVGDIRDRERLDQVLAAHKPLAILHFAALIEVGESVLHPGRFYDNNVGGTITLIEAARAAGIGAMVFSSTCATFGAPVQMPMGEDHPQQPLNPYGRSKLIVEQMLADYERYSGLRSVSLRYFNAAGADEQGRIGERHEPETHAIPLALQAVLGQRSGFKLFGDDYDTRDGTAIRDYVHVSDLADAHVRALRYLLEGGVTTSFNLGTGNGTSVRELLTAVEAVTGKPFPVEVVGRRQGDAPMLVANGTRCETVLGWKPQRSLHDIVASALAWHTAERDRAASASKDRLPA
ncbi:UDP-glucose 4-epimerase GalE [Brevundimonas vitis]|uniref:UDP-glucose 4-epimerase n=1 Tax=Brevundimonas vitisensis TaxID=2800818 RepID=A0ABX7BMW2_9CAUL|nr:UDP-glucose 4-epimerase GalE [Brevundimonas vitisensis]QQQ18213.1 UDP-glucose 4-epimerase GalE [Brevundimonas vitisensis]